MSSRSFAVDGASILTYPILRPSPAFSSFSRLRICIFRSTFRGTFRCLHSHIRPAVDTAIEQERLDKLGSKSGGDPERSSGRLTDDGPSTPCPASLVSRVRPPSATTHRSQIPEAQEHDIRTNLPLPLFLRHPRNQDRSSVFPSKLSKLAMKIKRAQ
jgi:hypothetical protein